MRVAVLGLGEAGRIFAEAYRDAGHDVVGFDPGPVEAPSGIRRVDSASEAAEDSELVLSLTTARFAVSAAQAAHPALAPGAVFIDLNASAPQVKEEVAEALGTEITVVDGAVIGSVRQHGAAVQVLLAGPGSDRAAELLQQAGTRVTTLDGTVGDATRRKLVRSIFMKGLGALIHETVEAADGLGEPAWVREQIAEVLTGGHETLERLASGTEIHAGRRSAELADSLELIADLGGTWPVTHAAMERHRLLARRTVVDVDALGTLRSLPTAALGDGGDRLGFVGGAVHPVWNCPAIAGRAFTVSTHAGDNQALHRALQEVRSGDVLVISAESGTERALLGELIAERALAAGVVGIVLDGAVRDVDGIAEAGLPVWAGGVSAAGPYKGGPGRLRESVAVGHAVCHHGDVVVADAEGVLFLPPSEVSSAIAAAEAVLEDEERRRRAIRDA
ncbi:NAD(P)-binding domain-containing protein [Nesterenkonia aerolata]|uniref:Putative 4-hydroxy-4-methyl-2-oxoglutarate aldolase n=1 Tax=Nesterenkonia aerolata TaxID=3074079 RepID=A0ABU2DSG8_9MICC|nr:NAD(P)-binding domain-containing protein [Nesterenkonia sp. LY-0111]MDR8019320.1 NAD(P)-binding domain-containing protein [Nesterenkonia sp. LY-0111]